MLLRSLGTTGFCCSWSPRAEVPGGQALITINYVLLGSKCGGGASSPGFRCGNNLEPVSGLWLDPASHVLDLVET